MKMKYKLKGFAETKELLNRLPDRVENRVLQGAASAGARVLARAAKVGAPVGDEPSVNSKKYGSLKKNIRTLRLKRVPRGTKAARVDTGRAFWGVILQKGSRYIPANPWFTSAINGSVEAALLAIRDYMVGRIEKEATKLAQETGSLRRK